MGWFYVLVGWSTVNTIEAIYMSDKIGDDTSTTVLYRWCCGTYRYSPVAYYSSMESTFEISSFYKQVMNSLTESQVSTHLACPWQINGYLFVSCFFCVQPKKKQKIPAQMFYCNKILFPIPPLYFTFSCKERTGKGRKENNAVF